MDKTTHHRADGRMLQMTPPSNADATQASAVVIRPPNQPSGDCGRPTIFLAGPTTCNHDPDWRARLCTAISDLPSTILDPKNLSWDSTWREDRSDPNWVAQVEWEMKMRETADVVVFFFEAGTDAPITLLELGLSLATNSATAVICVYADGGYSKRGNVEVACEKFGVAVWQSEDGFLRSLRRAIESFPT